MCPPIPAQVFRVLRPGGTFVFVQRVRGGGLQPLVLGGPPAVGECAAVGWRCHSSSATDWLHGLHSGRET